MKKFKFPCSLLIVGVIFFITNSCSTSDPTIETTKQLGSSTPGTLEVFFASVNLYFGGAEVYLYQSDAARTNDPQRQNAFEQSLTDQNDPTDKGAFFYNLPFGHYYFYCSTTYNQVTYYGVGDCWVPMGVTTKIIVQATQ